MIPALGLSRGPAKLIMRKTAGPIFEYACHEGNYGLTDILAGARAAEKKRSN